MSKRKNYLINKKFQLKTTFSIIGIILIISVLIIAIITSSMLINNARIDNALKTQDNIVHYLTSLPSVTKDPVFDGAIKEISGKHTGNMKMLQKMINYNKILLIAVLLIIALSSIILYFVLIRKTHKISGPIWVMSNCMKEIIDGKHPVLRELRAKDELKDFYELFRQMVDSLKKK